VEKTLSAGLIGRLPDPEETPLLTVEEALPFLRTSKSTAYLAIQAGQVPSVRISGRILIPTAALRRMFGL